MSDLPLPPAPLLLAFVAAALVLAVSPGPGVVYIVTRTLAQGRGAGLASVAGVAIGNLANAAAAAIGLAALLAASAAAFELLRYAGAAYLCWLGVQALRGGRAEQPAGNALPAGRWRVLRQGIAVALLNPKTTLFFAAFLPQFMQPLAPTAQALALGALFVAIAATTDAGYVLLAAAVAPALQASRGAARFGRFAAAAAYFGLGLWALLSGSRPVRSS